MPSFDQQPKIVVLDVETTGTFRTDRIVEISLITLDENSMPIDEYDTLVNPERDIGLSHLDGTNVTSIHGITATMVANAPTFEEIAPAVARRLDDAVLVGHNIAFDIRFLKREFERLDESSFDPGIPVCTYETSGLSLENAVSEFNLSSQQAHRALTDARMCAELMTKTVDGDTECAPAFCVASGDPNPRTLRRGAVDPTKIIKRKISPIHSPWNGDSTGMYRYVLNHVLDDGKIDSRERKQLEELAEELQLSNEQVKEICQLHLATLVAAVERDGIVGEDEHDFLERIAKAMGLENEPIPSMTDLPEEASVEAGMTVCFSGDATMIDSAYTRSFLEKTATLAHLVPRPSVTKKLDMLVLFDPNSYSGKAQKARKYGISIMSVEQFLDEIFAGRPN